MNSPDADPGYRAMFPAGVRWRNEVSARAALQVGTYSPGRRPPRGELLAYPGGHFDFYVGDPFGRVVSDQVEFLGRTI